MPAYDRSNDFACLLRGEKPFTRVYEDEFALAFQSIPALAPVHVVIIPKGEYISNVDFSASAPPEMIAGFWRAVGAAARQLGLDDEGYRLVTNHGHDGRQIVFHFHVHILGGRQLPRLADMWGLAPSTSN